MCDEGDKNDDVCDYKDNQDEGDGDAVFNAFFVAVTASERPQALSV